MEKVEVKYNPTIDDYQSVSKILDFLHNNHISYRLDNQIFGCIWIDKFDICLRYINTDNCYIGETYKDINGNAFIMDQNYLYRISKFNEDILEYRTIIIYDYELNDIIKWNIIQNYILTGCNKVKTRIYARDCYIKEIKNSDVYEFLINYSMYGYRSATITYGVYTKKSYGNKIDKDELVMVYSFGHNYYGQKKTDNSNNNNGIEVEVIRVSTKLSCQVIGGSSKCLKHFLNDYKTITFNNKTYKIKSLKFYVDANHNDGKSLSKLGFGFIGWKSGFYNKFKDDCIIEKPGKPGLYMTKGMVCQRKPEYHKEIKEFENSGKVGRIPSCGVMSYIRNII